MVGYVSVFMDCYGYNLLEKYNKNTKQCIVKFLSNKAETNYIGEVFLYLYEILHHEEIGVGCGISLDREGNKIPKKDILKVEYLD